MVFLKWFLTLTLIAFFVSVGYLFFNKPKDVSYNFIKVKKGTIIENVSVTGSTVPMQNVSLAFSGGGTIAHTYFSLGDKVHKGDIIAKLNDANLSAALAEASASVAAQKATLRGLINGAQPEDISLTQTSLESAQSNLEEVTRAQAVIVENAYRALLNTNIVAETATTTQISPPVISGMYNKTDTGVMKIKINGTPNGGYFSATGFGGNYTGKLENVVMDKKTSSPAVPIGDTGLFLRLPNSTELVTTSSSVSGVSIGLTGLGSNISNSLEINAIPNDYNDTNWTITIPNTASSYYYQNYNSYQQALQNQKQAIAAAQTQIDQAKAGLTFKKAGPVSESIAAQQARVNQAWASVMNAQANLQNIEIIAPIDGTITQQDAKVGEQALPGMQLVSIIGSNGFEVDAGISEKDMGKIQLGNEVEMTFDVFPHETFTGSIFYIAPNETNKQGVVTYLIKVFFNTSDTRLKSGLTANLIIHTKKIEDTLILPSDAIMQNDSGSFVEILDGAEVKYVPVALGIRDDNGNEEILAGVKEGQQVINLGLITK